MATVYSIKAFVRKWVDAHTNWTMSMDNWFFKKPGELQSTFIYLQADTDLLLCVSERSESGHYYAEDRTTPTMTTPVSVLFAAFTKQRTTIITGDDYFMALLCRTPPTQAFKRKNGFSIVIIIVPSWKLLVLQRSSHLANKWRG